jgi:hypothetical protein
METTSENNKIEIGKETLKHLNTTRKWAMFLSILGFIFIGLLLIIGIIAGTFLSAFKTGDAGPGIPESVIIVLFFVMATLYFFPIHFLFRFSKHSAHAIETLNKEELYKAFRNLKSYFVYQGVLIIIGLSIYVFVLIISGTSLAFLKSL